MARFYASIQGNRGEATRMGTASSGIKGHIRGWDVGARVECHADHRRGENPNKDVVEVVATCGSNSSRGFHIATLYEANEGGVEIELIDSPEMRNAVDRFRRK